jgi:L-arabinose isomerase
MRGHMNEIRKARVGLLGLMFDLYDAWPELKPAMAEFGRRLVDVMAPFAEVEFPGVCSTREQVEAAVTGFEGGGQELILVVLLTYAPSHIALPALLATRLPVVIYNTQQLFEVNRETQGSDTTSNHGMHGVQDLANVLLRAGRPFHIVTGHYQDPRGLAEVKGWCDAARTAKHLAGLRIGLIGYAMEGMGDFGLDETAFLAQIGAEVHHLSMRSLAAAAKSAPQAAIAEQMARDRHDFQFDPRITDVEHEASARLEWALRETLRGRGLHGFASHFLAVGAEGWLDTLPFLAAAKLMAEGYGFGGEGDVTSAAAVCLMQTLAGQANFTEMFTMDFAANAALMMHMGEGNWRMARRDEPVRLLRSTLKELLDVPVDPLLLAFTLEPGPCTLASLTTVADGRLKLVVAEGEVVDHPYIVDLNRPHYKFRPSGDLCDFLTCFSLEGGSHHQAMAYGHWAGTLEKTAALLGIACARV